MRLRTLGGAALEGVAFARPKPLLLLAYLAMEGRQARRRLAELFWPDARDRMKVLTVTLTRLRQGAPGSADADDEHAWASVDTDAQRFLTHLERGQLTAALDLYQGPFLDGHDLRGAGVELEEWVFHTREFLAGHARSAMLELAERDVTGGAVEAATRRAEAAYRLAGAPALDPEEMPRLHALLRAGKSPYARSVRDEADAYGIDLRSALGSAAASGGSATAQSAPPRGVPLRSTAFVGRDLELTDVGILLSRPGTRLVTLLGPAGVGKTRLAVQVAHEQRATGAFAGGVHVVSLEGLSAGCCIATAIGEVLGLDVGDGEAPLEHVVAVLRERSALLVIDNIEHLMDGVASISELVRACPTVTVLVTSRERLHLEEEHVVPLAGLPYPDDDTLTLERSRRFDAVKLFERRARRARPDIELGDEQVSAIVAICTLVEGLPLGLELAAGWARIMPVTEIAAELGRSLDLLATPTRNVPERHASIRAAFEQSWHLLTGQQRTVLRRLAVFRGGFYRAAASAVAGATIPILANLVDKSLVRVDPQGRYDLHPLLHQFATECLEADPAEAETARARHAAFVTEFLVSCHATLRHGRQDEALAAIARELENARAAWEWLTSRGRGAEVRRCIDPLRVFFDMRKRYREGLALFTSDGHVTGETHQDPVVAAALLTARAWLTHQLGQYEEARTLAERAAPVLRAAPAPAELAKCCNVIAGAAWRTGDYAEARARWQEALALAEAHGMDAQLASFQANLALAEHSLGDFDAARYHLEASLARSRAEHDHFHVMHTLSKLGVLALDMEDVVAATACFEEGLAVAEAHGFPETAPLFRINLGVAAYLREDYPAAQDQTERALEVLRASDDRYLEGYALARLGLVAAALGDDARAEATFRRALAVGRDMTTIHIETVTGIADLRRRQGRTLEAITLYRLLERHPGLEEADRERCRQRLEALSAQAEPDALRAAMARGDTLQLEQVVTSLEPDPAATEPPRAPPRASPAPPR